MVKVSARTWMQVPWQISSTPAPPLEEMQTFYFAQGETENPTIRCDSVFTQKVDPSTSNEFLQRSGKRGR